MTPAKSTRFERQLESGGYRVPAIGFGTGTLTRSPDYFGKAADHDTATAAIRSILESPFPFLDTSRNYGDGISERWIGEVFSQLGGVPRGLLISTKLDREPGTDKFDAARARRSLEQSFSALRTDHVPILFLHDPEHARPVEQATGHDGPLRELMRMKEEGLATTVGLAAGSVSLMRSLLPHWDFDVILTHSRYTIVNRTAEPLIADAVSRGMAVINAAVMASGILATGATGGSRYAYRAPSPTILSLVAAIQALCEEFAVPIAAVSLQFSLRDPRFVSTIVGISRPERVAQTAALAAVEVPAELWQRLSAFTLETDDPELGRRV